jgi:hypothetical protein
VGPQTDLVHHHRRHRDGVTARPRSLRVELFGHLAHLRYQVGELGGQAAAKDFADSTAIDVRRGDWIDPKRGRETFA